MRTPTHYCVLLLVAVSLRSSCCCAAERVYVGVYDRVSAFDTSGNLLNSLPIGSKLIDVAVNHYGEVYVLTQTDGPFGHAINKYSPNGTWINEIVSRVGGLMLGLTVGPDDNLYFGFKGHVRQVTIEPDHDDGPRRGGDTQVIWRRPADGDKEFAKKSVQVHLAGPVAEMIYSGEPYHPAFVAEWAADWDGASQAATLLHADDWKRLQYLEQVSRRLYQQFQDDEIWMALAALADSLLAHETLEQEQIEEVLQELL